MGKSISNEEIDKAIDNLLNSNIDTNRISIKEVKDIYHKNIPYLLVPVVNISNENINNFFPIYRARPFNAVKNIYQYSEYFCPPINKPTGFGRCNWNGKNVFYGSENIFTALKETKEEYKDGSDFFVGEWVVNINKLKSFPKISFILYLSKDIDNKSLKQFLSKWDEYYRKDKRLSNIENPEYLHNKLSELFVKVSNKQYPITAFISDTALYGVNKDNLSQIKFPILLFPSSETNTKTVNYAIHPAFAWEYMELKYIYHIKLKNSNKLIQNIEYVKIGVVDEKRNIEWFNITQDLTKTTYSINRILCKCGKEYTFNELKDVELQYNDSLINTENIIINIQKLHNDELFNLGKNISFLKGFPERLEINIKTKLDNYKLIDNEVEHSNLQIDVDFRLPIQIDKIPQK